MPWGFNKNRGEFAPTEALLRHAEQRRRDAEDVPFWQEWVAAVELAFLQVCPIYCGYGIPHGEPVVLVPGFMGTDFNLCCT